ncbi:MAG: hypothetical protein ABEJ92_11940 [Halobacteriales archaeon]
MPEEQPVESPVELTLDLVRSAWNTVLTVYYANSVSWRVLKAGALVFFGFFLWSAGNLLLSYQPAWTWLHYVMAYGAVLIPYGPFHHLVVIPLALRWRRSQHDRRREAGKRLPNTSLVVFIAIVLVVGTFPTAPVVIDFDATFGQGAPDINPDLACVKSTGADGTAVHCHLTEAQGVHSVAVRSGGETVLVDDEPPFEWTVHEDELTTVVGQQQFQVVLQDKDGTTLRRFTRTLGMIPED